MRQLERIGQLESMTNLIFLVDANMVVTPGADSSTIPSIPHNEEKAQDKLNDLIDELDLEDTRAYVYVDTEDQPPGQNKQWVR